MFNSSLFSVYKREVKSYFMTPIALVFLTVFLVLSGFFTFKFGNFFEAGEASLREFFKWHPWLYLFIAPAISMRLWSEEQGSGTIELLLTLPIKAWEAMLAKFLAAWTFIGLALLLTFPLVITTFYLGDPDTGMLICGYLGSFFLAGAFLALGVFSSTLTDNQVISFVISTTLCLLFVLLGWPNVSNLLLNYFPNWFVEELSNMSFSYHFVAMQRGLLDLRDLLYFLLVIAFGLTSGVIVLERRRQV